MMVRGDSVFDIAPKGRFTARVIANHDGIIAGVNYAKALARTDKFDWHFLLRDGDEVKKRGCYRRACTEGFCIIH